MSYATHPVVHQWVYHFQNKDLRIELAQLAVIVIGLAVHDSSVQDCTIMQRRLLPHAQVCSQWILTGTMEEKHRDYNIRYTDLRKLEKIEAILDAIHLLGYLYSDQGKLAEAEEMYQRALQGFEKTLGAEHTSTLDIVKNLGILYANQGRLAEAEEMYQRALQGYENIFGRSHPKCQSLVTRISALHVCRLDQDREAHTDRTTTSQQQVHPKRQGYLEISSVRKENKKKQRFLRLRKLWEKVKD